MSAETCTSVSTSQHDNSSERNRLRAAESICSNAKRTFEVNASSASGGRGLGLWMEMVGDIIEGRGDGAGVGGGTGGDRIEVIEANIELDSHGGVIPADAGGEAGVPR
jgi:hypothetical protein